MAHDTEFKEKQALGARLERQLKSNKVKGDPEQSFDDWVREQTGKAPSEFLSGTEQKVLRSKFRGSDIKRARKGNPREGIGIGGVSAEGRNVQRLGWERAAEELARSRPMRGSGGKPHKDWRHQKPKFMKGGSYKGKSHMYAAGGMVKDMKLMEK